MALERAGSHYERGLRAMRNGDADRAQWEFDAALGILQDLRLDRQTMAGLQGTDGLSPFPTPTWLVTLATPPQNPAQQQRGASESEEPPLDAPALLSPEDQQAVTETPPEGSAPLPEPDVQQYDIPIVFNNQVKAFLQHFQTRKWEIISQAFERASLYLPMMRNIFRQEGLPEDLLNLAFIESAINPRATSRAKAAGIWQFMPSTGRRYGMRTSWWLDERRDPEKSTRAAAAYLKKLYRRFESWPLALAAYNAGEGKIQRAIQRQRTRDFWSLRLPRETRLFVPAFMAMTVIAREPARYGFSPPPEEPLATEMVSLRRTAAIHVIAQAAGTTVERMRELNPELIRWATPPGPAGYTLRIPAGVREEFLGALERIPPEQQTAWFRHTIRKGETAAAIGRRYRVDPQVILEMNGLRQRQVLKAGGTLIVPAPPAGYVSASVDPPPQPRRAARSTTVLRYTVKHGNSLSDIARAHAVSPEELRRWNDLPPGATLRPGQVLRIPRSPRIDATAPDVQSSPSSPATTHYVVKRGDTLWDIARAHAVSPEELRRWNDLPPGATLRPGQSLKISKDPF